MLVFVLVGVQLIELIPNTALAAMLITVGIKLTHPKEFINTLEKGKEQLLIFLVTIIFTLAVDLLAGIGAGILAEILVNLINGKPLKAIFSAPAEVSFTNEAYLIEISEAAVFSNYLGIKESFNKVYPPPPSCVILHPRHAPSCMLRYCNCENTSTLPF